MSIFHNTRRNTERTYRWVVGQGIAEKAWSLNKMKTVPERMSFVNKLDGVIETLTCHFGKPDWGLLMQILFTLADDRTYSFYRKTIRTDYGSEEPSSLQSCTSLEKVISALRPFKNCGHPTLIITQPEELKVYLLFAKLRPDVIYGWLSEILDSIHNMPVMTTPGEVNYLVKSLSACPFILNYVRDDIKAALKSSKCLNNINPENFTACVSAIDKTTLFHATDSDHLFELSSIPPISGNLKHDRGDLEIRSHAPCLASSSSPVTQQNGGSGYSEFISLIDSQEFDVYGEYDGLLNGHSTSLMPQLNYATPVFRALSPDPTPQKGLFCSTGYSHEFQVGDKVYVDASHLYSLDTGRSLVAQSLFVGPFEISDKVSDTVFILEIPRCFNSSCVLPKIALVSSLYYSGTHIQRLLLREINCTLDVDSKRGTALIQYADGAKSTVRLDELRQVQSSSSSWMFC